MMEGEGIGDGKANESTRKMVAELPVDVYMNITEDLGKNAWKMMGYEWLTN